MPLEIRRLIYQALLPDDDNQACQLRDRRDRLASHHCWNNLGFCCRRLYEEIGAFAAQRTIRISTRHDSMNLYSNASCLCHLRFFPPRRVFVDINPFQARETIPSIYTALLSASQYIGRTPALAQLEICFDGVLPRRTPPLYIDELDLERAPLHMIVLLFPFRLLRRVGASNISILGGPLNEPWSDCRLLSECAQRISRMMELEQPPDSLSVDVCTEILGALGKGIIWDEQGLSQLSLLGQCPRRGLGSSPLNGRDLSQLNHVCDICGNLFRSGNQIQPHLRLFHNDS
jgi:hypothetical protein